LSLTSLEKFYKPTNSSELVSLLNDYEDSALILAGGSFIHGLAARDLLWGVQALIDIRGMGLTGVSEDSANYQIGATTRLIDLARTSLFNTNPAFAAIADALTYPPKQILNVATIGGNIATACPFFDLPTALLALEADLQIEGTNGARDISLREFALSPFENVLGSNEFLSRIMVPKTNANKASAFLKLETNANDLALVNVAASLSLDSRGNCCNVRIALGGGVAGTPVRALAAEQLMENQSPSEELFKEAGELVLGDIDPISDHRASAAYRSAMAKVFTTRSLQRSYQRVLKVQGNSI